VTPLTCPLFFLFYCRCNAALDDYIVQDLTVDPYLPLVSNYFDFVIIPANVQLVQRPLAFFEEINRVLKPGGTVFCGLKLAHWSFLSQKQCRYFAETNFLEDVYAIGSFFHFAEGYTRPLSFDLTLPESSAIGKLKDIAFPQPRLDFYSVIQARKSKKSSHGKEKNITETRARSSDSDGYENERTKENRIEGMRYAPKVVTNPATKQRRMGPFY
jgi:SAM-dependent methyltransferase